MKLAIVQAAKTEQRKPIGASFSSVRVMRLIPGDIEYPPGDLVRMWSIYHIIGLLATVYCLWLKQANKEIESGSPFVLNVIGVFIDLAQILSLSIAVLFVFYIFRFLRHCQFD